MKFSVRRITFTALLMALNVLFSSFGVPVGTATLYLTDIAVCLAGILLDPFSAAIAGGFGAFLGDVFFYPKAMIVTLIVRTVQSVVISVFSRYIMKNRRALSSTVGCVIGIVIMTLGYTFLGAAVYKTLEASIIKMPFEALQASVGAIVALPVAYKFGLRKTFDEYLSKDK